MEVHLGPSPRADPLDAARGPPPLRVFDRVKQQAVMETSNARIDSYGHPEAETMLEIDGRAPAAARAADDHFRHLAPQGFDALEAKCQQRLKHRSLPRRPTHAPRP
jgi:hypothetical protein